MKGLRGEWLGLPLSPRQLEIVKLVVEGFRHEKIGDLLTPMISRSTVRTHIKFIKMKVGAETMPQAIFKLAKANII